MILFVPFILAFGFFLLYDKESVIKTFWDMVRVKYISRSKLFTALFNCIFCQSFWIGLILVLSMSEQWYYIFYIPVATVVIYKHLTI